MMNNFRPRRDAVAPAATRHDRVEKLNVLLEKLALLLSGAMALALPILVPALAPLHFVALLPWVVLFLHPRYHAHSAWVWLGSLILLPAFLSPLPPGHGPTCPTSHFWPPI